MPTMFVRPSTEALLQKLADRSGLPMSGLIDEAVRRFEPEFARGAGNPEVLRDQRVNYDRDGGD